MNRRQALGLGIGAALIIPSGLISWSCSKLEKDSNISEGHQEVLASAVDAIIPASETPGAKELGVDLFVTKMIADCYDEKAQKTFETGLKELNKKSKKSFDVNFADATSAQRLDILKNYPKEDGFINLLRQLTILGYTKSEYFMENIEKFEFIPGRYLGCVNIV